MISKRLIDNVILPYVHFRIVGYIDYEHREYDKEKIVLDLEFHRINIQFYKKFNIENSTFILDIIDFIDKELKKLDINYEYDVSENGIIIRVID